MDQMSNKVIALIIAVFLTITLLQVSVYYNIAQKDITVKATAVGFLGMCLDNHPIINAVPEQIAYINREYVYDVNTSVANDLNVSFSEDTPLFVINSSNGVIRFTPSPSDEGAYIINITVVSNCGLQTDSKLIFLSVEYENRPPVLDYIPNQVINQSDLFIYDVNASDPDNDVLFFGDNTTMFQINSMTGVIYFTPDQQEVGNQSVMIWVLDGRGGIDWQVVNFEIIDVNDAPVLHTIGAQTALINESYTYDANVTDVDVRPEWHNISFYDNASFFEINQQTGIISFTPDDAMNGTYFINISVTDGLLWDYEIISFSIVPKNHPPDIISWYPYNDTIEMMEGGNQYFNITKYDPDGTIPSTQWYLNSILLTGETNDIYTYYASYTSSGTHNVTVVITDGLLFDSHEWTLYVRDAVPPASSTAPPSGSAMPPPCIENWRCSEWSMCPIYEIQTRTCTDLNICGTTTHKPEEKRGCVYTPQPNCTDSIINCHDGGCEIWIDCGGPCPPCSTCDDKIKNCHTLPSGRKTCEESVDCGGPCPPCTPEQLPVCGNAICEEGEILACFQDCGISLGQFLLVVIILGGASIVLYRTSAFLLVFYRKKISPLPYTDMEMLGATTLRKIHLIQLEMGKKPERIIISEFSAVMREFFAKAFAIKKKFTYIELAEVARKNKIEKALASRITDFSIKMTEIEYGVVEASLSEISNVMKSATLIVEKLTGIKVHESLDKRAEDEINKWQPKDEEVKLPEVRPDVSEKKYVKTEKDKEAIKTLQNLIVDGEKAMKAHKPDEAEKTYSKIRDIYDSFNPEVKKELYNETIRIIRLYNAITLELK
ncbi:MAG: hypothetical protein NTU57_04890 [Candidatus Aenigmarchaeota archaeon]|nr:hypothetical protein [Candidatus Aenigmarchaeota archaeon]